MGHKANLLRLLKFIGVFFGLMIGMNVLYNLYLNQYSARPDGVTNFVAKSAAYVLEVLGFNTDTKFAENGAQEVWFYLEGYGISRIIEGCNGISVIILFLSLHFAFFHSFKRNFLYALIGVAAIFIINIFRNAALSWGFLYYPEWGDLMHDVLFPLSIYGLVIVLWFIWIWQFAKWQKSHRK